MPSRRPDAATETVVLDTGAILHGAGPDLDGSGSIPRRIPDGARPRVVRWLMPDAAAAEIKPGGPTGRALERALGAGLEVVRPDATHLVAARAAAGATGDMAVLSDADMQVIAVAHEHAVEGEAVEIWTDDHAIQNVATRLRLPWRPVAGGGIRTEVTWYHRCAGCGRWIDGDRIPEECAVCGSEIRRTRRRPPGHQQQ